VQAAVGVDYRRETYSFNGSNDAVLGTPDIFNAAFDNINALTPKKRTVKAAYAEILIRFWKSWKLRARCASTNIRVSVRRPIQRCR
jgi:iron complex outermembrane receptor protein